MNRRTPIDSTVNRLSPIGDMSIERQTSFDRLTLFPSSRPQTLAATDA